MSALAPLLERLCCKTIFRIRARKIDSRSGVKCATLIQELVRSDSIVAYFYSTAVSIRGVDDDPLDPRNL
jgi:hypothetical protein